MQCDTVYDAETRRAQGTNSVLHTLDASLEHALGRLLAAHPNTVVMLLGDHGLHMGLYPLTHAGSLEHHLPALFLVLPRALLAAAHRNVSEALAHNEQALITAYDLYRTLAVLPTLPALAPRAPRVSRPSSRSLFEHIPATRSCADAGIAPLRCICNR